MMRAMMRTVWIGAHVAFRYRWPESVQTWDFNTCKMVSSLSHELEECWTYCCSYGKTDGSLIGLVGSKANEARLIER
jgi:hypothetical protein